MKLYALLFLASVLLTSVSQAQEILKLPITLEDETVTWNTAEREYMSTIWNNMVVTNVSEPELLVYRPANPNGTAVIIAPGGGLYALSLIHI